MLTPAAKLSQLPSDGGISLCCCWPEKQHCEIAVHGTAANKERCNDLDKLTVGRLMMTLAYQQKVSVDLEGLL